MEQEITPSSYETLDQACENLKATVICQGSYHVRKNKMHVVHLQSTEDPSVSHYLSRNGRHGKWIIGISPKGKSALCKKW